MPPEPDRPSFVAAFAEWVEACFFDEREAADRRLDTVLGFPAGVVLVESVSLLARLVERSVPAGASAEDLGAALVQHLIVSGSDARREQLICEVVTAAAGPPAARSAVLAAHGTEAVTRAALECASYLAQVVAERDGVVPSVVLEDL